MEDKETIWGSIMKFLHYQVQTSGRETIRVDLQRSAANVRIMDTANFNNYRRGLRHRYYGGHYRTSPAVITAPHAGTWHVVVDLGGYAGRVSASVSIV